MVILKRLATVVVVAACAALLVGRYQRELATMTNRLQSKSDSDGNNLDKVAEHLRVSLSRGDWRFLAVDNSTNDVVGIEGGQANPLVIAKGIRRFPETSAQPNTTEYINLMVNARPYVKAYNRLLLQHVKQSNPIDKDYKALIQKIDRELLLMEQSEPENALESQIKSGKVELICIYDSGFTKGGEVFPGVSSKDVYSKNIPYEVFVGTSDVVTAEQKRRIQKLIVNFISQYNQLVMTYYRTKGGATTT